MRSTPSRLVVPAALGLTLASLGGCAPPGPYPSLEPRPIEKALADSDDEKPAPALPDDAGLPARIATPLAAARQGQAEFNAALPAARAAAEAAGAAESDSWIEAQQALSRLEAARAATTRALAELDALALAEAQARLLSPGDLERLETAVRTLQAIADGQSAEVARLGVRISG